MNNRFGMDSAMWLAALTGLLYTWSTAHYQGYIRYLGLSADMMERNFHQVIYDGLLVSFAPILVASFLLATALWFYSYLILPSYIDWLRSSVSRRRKIIRLKRKLFGRRSETAMETRAKYLFLRVFLIVGVGIFYLLSLVYFEAKGSDKARELATAVSSNEDLSGRVMTVQIDSGTKDLVFIGCGVRVCAGLEPKTNMVHYVNGSHGYSFRFLAHKGLAKPQVESGSDEY